MTWQLTRLSEFLSERVCRIKFEDANALGLQRIKKIDFSGQIHLDEETETKTDMIRVCDGDLVISGINAAKGAISVYTGDEDVLATIHYSAYQFNPDRISIRFLKWFFKSPEFSMLLKQQVAGGIKTELKPKHVLPLQIRLPSLSEQLTIAEKLNIFHVDRLRIEHEISRQEKLVRQLRESILDEALRGELTKKWREFNSNCEPASLLLNKIKQERVVSSGNTTKVEKLVRGIQDDEVPFQIPDTWEWCRLGSIITEKPRNGFSPKPVSYETDIKTLKLSATSSGVFDGTRVKYLDASIDKDSYLWLRDGDILIQRANSLELVGTAAVFRGPSHEYVYPDLMMKFRPIYDACTAYVHAVLLSKFTRAYYQRNATGAAGNMPKINQETVMNTLIPLPPLEEQIALMEHLSVLTELIYSIEEAIDLSRSNLRVLSEVVLGETFSKAA